MKFEYVRRQFREWVEELSPGITEDQKFWAAQAFMAGWAGGLMHGLTIAPILPGTIITASATGSTPPTDSEPNPPPVPPDSRT